MLLSSWLFAAANAVKTRAAIRRLGLEKTPGFRLRHRASRNLWIWHSWLCSKHPFQTKIFGCLLKTRPSTTIDGTAATAISACLPDTRRLLVSSHTSPNQLHECMTPSETFGQEKFSLAASAELLYAFFLLHSSILWTLTMSALETGGKWAAMVLSLHLDISLHLCRKSMWHGPARHLLISSAVMDAWLWLGLFCVPFANLDIQFAGESMILLESSSWFGASDPDRQKDLQQTQTIWDFNTDFWKWVLLEPSMPKWPCHEDLKHQKSHLPAAKKYASTCEQATPCASELKNFRNRTGCGCGIQMFRLALIGSKLSHCFGKHIPIGKRESYAACAGSNGAQALKLFTNLWVCLEHLVSWLGSHSDIACSFIRHNFLPGTCRFNTRELLMLLTCEHRLTSVGSCWT